MVEVPVEREREVVREEVALPPPALLRRASWGAIFAGTVVALGIFALLGLLGLALGLGAIDPMDPTPFSGIGTGTIIWWIITSILALGIGGYVGGRLAGIPRSLTGMLHGLAIWSLVTLISLWLATSAIGKVVNMAASVVVTTAETAVGAVSAVGGAAGAALPDDPQLAEALRQQGLTREQIRQEAAEITQAAGLTQQDAQAAQQAIGETAADIVRTPGDAGQDLNQLIDRLFGGPGAVIGDAERQRLVEVLAQRAGVSPEEARQIAARWEQQAAAVGQQVEQTAQQARLQAGETSAEALDALSKAAWGAFIASLISLIAALAGSALGAPHGPLTDERERRREYS